MAATVGVVLEQDRQERETRTGNRGLFAAVPLREPSQGERSVTANSESAPSRTNQKVAATGVSRIYSLSLPRLPTIHSKSTNTQSTHGMLGACAAATGQHGTCGGIRVFVEIRGCLACRFAVKRKGNSIRTTDSPAQKSFLGV